MGIASQYAKTGERAESLNERVSIRMRKPVRFEDRVFLGYQEMADAYGIHYDTARYWVKTGKRGRGPYNEVGNKKEYGERKIIRFAGMGFFGYQAMAAYFGVHYQTARKWHQQGE